MLVLTMSMASKLTVRPAHSASGAEFKIIISRSMCLCRKPSISRVTSPQVTANNHLREGLKTSKKLVLVQKSEKFVLITTISRSTPSMRILPVSKYFGTRETVSPFCLTPSLDLNRYSKFEIDLHLFRTPKVVPAWEHGVLSLTCP